MLARDQEADGDFWYSVSSTRVYCRPSCPARTAHPRFVRLHDTLDDARATGYRPCARCNPAGESLYDRNREGVRRACALIAPVFAEQGVVEAVACGKPGGDHFQGGVEHRLH